MANSAKNIDNKLIAPAKRYADAILEIAKSKNELDKFHEDIKTVCDAYDSSEEFKNFMNHPIIPASEKKDAVKNIFDGKIAPDVLNLVYILVERNKFYIDCLSRQTFQHALIGIYLLVPQLVRNHVRSFQRLKSMRI